MTIYVLLILYTAPPPQLFLNTFSSKSKCEKLDYTIDDRNKP